MTPEATFQEIRNKSERGAGRSLGQYGPSAKIRLITINASRQPKQDRMQRVSTESETKIKIQAKRSLKQGVSPGRLWRTKMQFGKMLYLHKFRYSGVSEVTDYEPREVRVQIRIRNRQKPPNGLSGQVNRQAR